MPTLRNEPLAGRTLLFAPRRSARPHAFPSADPSTVDDCPFCAGREDLTPPEITRRGGSNWTVRVVPNKYPAVSTKAESEDDGEVLANGVHEVIIESPGHDDTFLSLSDRHAEEIVSVWVERVEALSNNPAHASVILFHNQGPRAGESIAHPHSQVLGLPFVPHRVALETAAHQNRACLLCQVIARADESSLTVDKNDGFVLIAPWASRLPYQVWAIPRDHQQDIRQLSASNVRDFAGILRSALDRIDRVLPRESINWSVQQSPVNPARPFHWYLEIVPRVVPFGGFELATGTFINIVDPEHTANLLRRYHAPNP